METEARPISMPITKAPQDKKKIQTLFPVDSTQSNSVHSDPIAASQNAIHVDQGMIVVGQGGGDDPERPAKALP